MKIKVIFIQDTLANAGTENSLLHILPYFSDDIEYKVIYLYPQHDLLPKYTAASIPTLFLDLKGKYDFLKGYSKLKRLFQDEKPNLVVSSLLRSNLLARVVCKVMRIPLVGTLVSDSYNKDALNTKGFLAKIKFRFFWSLDRYTSHIPKLYIANSAAIALTHKSTLGIPLFKSKVIYRGRAVPEKTWKGNSSNETTYNFVSYGRLIQLKGYKELIAAFYDVQSQLPNCTLTIYGEGNYRSELEQQIQKLNLTDKVSLPGIHQKVSEELYNYDCFIFPSWYEGFSGALVEAMLSGIPIIASDIPMNLEAVKANETALTFPVKNSKILAEQMIFAIQNPTLVAELGSNARKVSTEKFDIKKTAKQYEDLLRSVNADK